MARATVCSINVVFVYLLPLVGGTNIVADDKLLFVSVPSGVAIAASIYRIRVIETAGLSADMTGVGTTIGVPGGSGIACGSVFLAAMFGTSTTRVLMLLPIGGTGVFWSAVVLLGLSIFWVTEGIDESCSCDPP